jgi:16S rRNA (guanine966-N2)-methyltransferase
VTRIVGGSAKGRRLTVPPAGTRPTSERAREGLFNTLDTLLDLDGAAVLDLFAGSGAVGLEALSRGAARATLVESDRAAAVTIRRNVTALGLAGAQVLARPVASVLAGPPDVRYDVVFADPPYALDGAELTALLATLVTGEWPAQHAVLAVERAARSPDLVWPDLVTPLRQRRYGEGVLWYGRAMVGR